MVGTQELKLGHRPTLPRRCAAATLFMIKGDLQRLKGQGLDGRGRPGLCRGYEVSRWWRLVGCGAGRS
jgi:hypothetical protein